MVKLFRILIIISLLFAILGGAAATVFEQNHPEIENFLSRINDKDFFYKMPDIAAMIAGLLIIIAYFVISFALLRFKSWARDANLIFNLISFLIVPFWGFMLISPLESIFYNLTTFISGLILALSYFSPLKDEFKESAISRALNRIFVKTSK